MADLDEPLLEVAIGDQTLSLSLSVTEPPTVTRIALTDQPDLAYDEGDPCPRRLATDPPGP